MFKTDPVTRLGAAAVFACVALVGPGDADAKIFSTGDSVQDFRFHQGRVLYTNPSLDQVTLELTPDNRVVLTSIDVEGAALRSAPDGRGNIVGTLDLRGGVGNDGSFAGNFMIFGSRPSDNQSSTRALVSGTFDAMQADDDDQSLGFLFGNALATGQMGTQLRDIGIYALVAGLSEQEWIERYSDQSGLQGLMSASNEDPASPQAVPLPATPLLLLAGLVGLGFLRHRR
jgi:hypothetical protein